MNIQDLKCRGVKFTPELKERVLKEVIARFDGIRDDRLQEPLDEIIVNQFTAMDLEEQEINLDKRS